MSNSGPIGPDAPIRDIKVTPDGAVVIEAATDRPKLHDSSDESGERSPL
jgi:hypothetical protein